MESRLEPLSQRLSALTAIQVAALITSFAVFLVTSFIEKLWPSERAARLEKKMSRRLRSLLRRSTLFDVLGVVFTYLVDAAVCALKSLTGDGSVRSDQVVATPYDLSSALLWIVVLLRYFDSGRIVDCPLFSCAVTFLVAEVALTMLRSPHDVATKVCRDTRLSLLALLLLLCVLSGIRLQTAGRCLAAEYSQPAETEKTHESCRPSSKTVSKATKTSRTQRTAEQQEDVWKFIEDLKTLILFFWPSGKPRLQLRYVALALCVAVERILRAMVPLQAGWLTNAFSESTGLLPWKDIIQFMILHVLYTGGVIIYIRKLLWLPLENFFYLNLSTTAFDHVMSLSADYHDRKDTSKLWHIIQRGQGVNYFVEKVAFKVFPLMVDLGIVISVLYYVFDAYMALIVATMSVAFAFASGRVVSKQRQKRKEHVAANYREYAILNDSASNWHTVSYFNRAPYEHTRYRSAVKDTLKSKVSFRLWWYVEQMTQTSILACGLMAACTMAAYQVVSRQRPVGSFVILLNYWSQLSEPLQIIASGLGQIVIDLADVEELLDLLRRKPTVADVVDAQPIVIEQGRIEFSGVNFSYDGKRTVLQDINFTAQPGQTTALVGETGGGKSTILKLISRFHDPTTGAVKIDGQDISQVTLSSLHEITGVVPQNPALFRESIMTNIRYARLDATDDEVMEACKAVSLHEKIMTFTDGYSTVVGEHGATISGGELQRIAIARAIIKDPKIVLLDEATSSVDSKTEAQVQESLKLLCAGRTTLVVAHRLSTIVNADNIIVIGDKGIIEQGTHAELLGKRGAYYRLCSRQGVVDLSQPENGAAATAVLAEADSTDASEGAVTVDDGTKECDAYKVRDFLYPKPNPPQYSKSGEAGFVPRSLLVQGHVHPQSCLAETQGNQDMVRYAEGRKFNRGTEAMDPNAYVDMTNDEKENLPMQVGSSVAKTDGLKDSFNRTAKLDKGCYGRLDGQDTEVTARTQRKPTRHTPKRTKNEQTAPALTVKENTQKVPGNSNFELAEGGSDLQQETMADGEGETLPKGRRRRRRRGHRKNKTKGEARS